MSGTLEVSSEDFNIPNSSVANASSSVDDTEDKDLINSILVEMKNEFNRADLSGKNDKECELVDSEMVVETVETELMMATETVVVETTPKVRSRSLDAVKIVPKDVTKEEVPVPKNVATLGSDGKPRIVITLKAGDDSSDGHKKLKSKNRDSQGGSDEVWTVKVESSSEYLTGKRSLRSQTAMKSPAEPEGVKRSARRRSKDLPRESVLQSAMARKEKSFSLEEKQCRTPRHRSPVSSPEKPTKMPETKKTPPKMMNLTNTALISKVSKLDIQVARVNNVDIPEVPAAQVLKSEILDLESEDEGSTSSTNPSHGRSRLMLAMKSAPVPGGLSYTKTGKRRYKPFRGLRYSLTGSGSRRARLAGRQRHSESPVDHGARSRGPDLPMSTRDSASGGTGSDISEGPVIAEACQPSRHITPSLKRRPDFLGGEENAKVSRQDITPSPSPADSSELPAKPESSSMSSGARTANLCFCQTNSQLYVSTATTSDIYCQAVDNMDDRLVGCCNSIVGSEVRMLRPSRKVAYMILCTVHIERLVRHNSCPGCGVFCTQGKFVQCSSNHFYHRECQLPGNLCPHCGIDSPDIDAMLFFKSHRNPVFVPQQTSYKKLPSAKMGFVGPVSTNEDAPPESETLLRLPSGREVSTNGLPPSLDREKLEHLLSVANNLPPSIAARFSIKNLYQAAKSGNAERIINVLASGLNVNTQFREGATCLHLVCGGSGGVASVHVLSQAGAELDAMDREQNTALMLATLAGNNAAVKYLVKAGASVTLKGSDGQTALHLAAKSGNLEACHYLLSVADVGRSYIDSEDDGGWTPLVWAAEHCHTQVAKFLLERRADPFVRDSEQNIALHWSAFSGCVDISELLLNRASEVNCANVHGDTPLHIGARQNMYHCVLLLLMRGARVNVVNKAGETPLECCAVKPSDCFTVIHLNKQLQAITKHPARRLLCNDISRGKETNPVQVVNDYDREPEPTDFVYVVDNCYTSNISVDRTITSLQSCRCTRDNCTGLDCNCGNVSLQCWYDPHGKLLPSFNFADPPMIFECNPGCACHRVTCRNRVVQRGLTCRFQVFRTRGKGWGVRTLRHIAKGAYVCEYVGEIISDCEADHREDDSYLFDLDNRDGETYCIDARHYGNVARFINHMCVPNLMPVRVFIDHQDLHFPRIAFFANRDIAADEELGFDYGEKFWIIKCKSFTCTCGAESCRYSDTTIQQTLEAYKRRQQIEETQCA